MKYSLMVVLAMTLSCELSGQGVVGRWCGDLPEAKVWGDWVNLDNRVLGESDNVESVSWVPGCASFVALASKSRTLFRFSVEETGLVEQGRVLLFDEDRSESELTHIEVSPKGSFAALTRTELERVDGVVSGCGGWLVLVSVLEEDFGRILAEFSVGPMPDALAFSDNGETLVVANERDSIWGKCVDGSGNAPEGVEPSLSIFEISSELSESKERFRLLTNGDSDLREPESLSIVGDNVAVSLQDSHELFIFSLSDLDEADLLGTSVGKVVGVAQDAAGTDAWPDGVVGYPTLDTTVFAVAGEGNDTVSFYDISGNLLSVFSLGDDDLNSSFPRDRIDRWGPLFNPDSLAFVDGAAEKELMVSLKYAGAVAVLDVKDPTNVMLRQVIKVGGDESGLSDESEVAPEGIAADANGRFVVIAGEGNSTLSLLGRE